jgi:hypothetical protein
LEDLPWRGGRRMGLFSNLISFAAGIYTGVYVSQNYNNVPKVEDPKTLLKKLQDYLEDVKKDK